MNVYDFDDTIYDGDSTIDFFWFCFKKNKKIIQYFPKWMKVAILYKLKKISKTQMKEVFFVFLKDIENVEEEIELFWNKNESKIKQWYLQSQKEDDLVISASPEFLLKPICQKIGIQNLIASNVDKKTGKFYDENCKGEEKVKQFRQKYKDASIENFYSDSLSDTPLASIAKNAYLVVGNARKTWPQK